MMMTASTKGLVVAVVALAAAAVAGATKASGSRGVGSFTITNNINSKSDDENKYLDEVVFSHDMLNEYRLYMKESDLNWLNTHELIEQYVPGNVTFQVGSQLYQDDHYQDVGIRYKGSKGSLEFCFTNATGNEGSNEWNKRLCKKLSLKVSFDKYNDEGRFHGMKKVQLHGMMNDNSLMRECLAYGLYRRMGLEVPRCAHAKVFINDKYEGVYLAVEYIDSRFLKHHFDDKDGVLIKEKWPAITEEATKAEYFLGGVRNHKSSTGKKDVDPITTFSKKLWDASSSEEVGHLLHKYWDVDTIVDTLVVATVIDDWDSFFTFFPTDPNHHSPTDATNRFMPKKRFNHNYYIFQPSGRKQKLKLIQWDTDLTFSESGSTLELFFGCPAWTVPLCESSAIEASQYCTPCTQYAPYNVSTGSPSPNKGLYPAACDKIISYISGNHRRDVLERTWTFLEEIFIPEEIAKVTVAWTALLKDAQHADPNYPGGRDLFPDQPSSIKANWTEEVQSLVETIKHEYKRSLERTNPVYRPHIPDRKDIEKVFTCVKDCSEFLHDKGIKSLYTCYNICLFEVPLAV